MAIAITTDQLLIDIRNWYYRLRMVQAHLECSGVAGLTPAQLDYSLEVVTDLLEACEDAASFIQREAEDLEAPPEAGLGSSADPGDSGRR